MALPVAQIWDPEHFLHCLQPGDLLKMARSRRLRVLVADDEPAIREVPAHLIVRALPPETRGGMEEE